MKIRSIASIIAALALTACGASDSAPQNVNHPGHGAGDAKPAHQQQGDATKVDGAAKKGEHKHDFPGSVNTFHDSLAPVWHAEKGAERTQKTCDALPTLKTQAQTIVTDPVPEKAAAHADAYKQAANGLVASIDALAAACAADGRADFEAKFHEVHEAFHAVVKHLGHTEKGEDHGHEGHGEHKGHDHKH